MRCTRPPSWSMRIGASSRPTLSRREAVSARTCSGPSMLRWNRMKPQGSASLKKALSSGVIARPEQPTMKARAVMARAYDPRPAGSTGGPGLVISDEALSAGGFQARTEGCGVVPRQGPDAHPVGRLAVDLRLQDQGRETAEVACITLLKLVEGLTGLALRVAHAELDGEAWVRTRRRRGFSRLAHGG